MTERPTSSLIDISVGLTNDLVTWPDNPPPHIERVMDLSDGDMATVSRISMGVHTGTHMDAPRHFVRDGAGIDQLPLDVAVGPARVIDCTGMKVIEKPFLEEQGISNGHRILLKTDNSTTDWPSEPFNPDFVYLSTDAARYLAACNVSLVGIDYLSVSGYDKNEVEVHDALLGAGVWVIEGLMLRDVQPGRYELICLPLKIDGADGAPARALLRPLG